MKPTISIIIPAYNEAKSLPKCLNSLVSQKTQHQFEVILVDNNSTDNTSQVAQTFQSKLNLKIVKETIKGRGSARKTGFDQALADLILSTDADTILPHNWIEDLTKPFVDPKIVATTGPCKITDCRPNINQRFNFLQPKFMHLYRLAYGHYWLSGFNFAIRKDIYKKSGGFNPHINGLEDIDLGFRVRKLGKIYFCKNLIVVFSGRRFCHSLLKGSLQYVTSFIKYKYFHSHKIRLEDIRT